MVAIGETARLTFQVSPLSGKGLLAQQTRDALKAILKLNGGAPIIHLRAISVGNGDLRRISQIVSEGLRGPLPSISVIQAGSLSAGDAQIVLEAVSLGKKKANTGGLAFHSLETLTAKSEPPLQQAVERIAERMSGQTPLAVTCFVSDLDSVRDQLGALASRFPGAAIDVIQTRRLAWQTEAGCEGVARTKDPTAPTIAFTGTQAAFGSTPQDAALALERLDRALSDAGATRNQQSLIHIYAPAQAAFDLVLRQLGSAPKGTACTISVEAAGSANAAFSLDAIVPVR